MSYSATGRGIGFLKFGSSVVSTVLPSMITVRIFQVARISATGSPSIRMMSAILPGAIVPRSLSLCSNSALRHLSPSTDYENRRDLGHVTPSDARLPIFRIRQSGFFPSINNEPRVKA